MGPTLPEPAKAMVEDVRRCATDKGLGQTEDCLWVASIVSPTRLLRLDKLLTINPTHFHATAQAFDVELSDDSLFYTFIDDACYLNIATEVQTQKEGIGRTLMEAAFEHYGAKFTPVRGNWAPKMPSNFDAFNTRIRADGTEKAAARKTFTGKIAGEYGFTRVKVVDRKGEPGRYTDVEIDFLPE